MTDKTETEIRIEKHIARASVRHMSNAKWRKLFAALHKLKTPLASIGIKLVGPQGMMSVTVPGPEFEFGDNFGEQGGLSFVPFAHIDYVGISCSAHNADTFIRHLNQYGKWPMKKRREGVFIHGYEWPLESNI